MTIHNDKFQAPRCRRGLCSWQLCDQVDVFLENKFSRHFEKRFKCANDYFIETQLWSPPSSSYIAIIIKFFSKSDVVPSARPGPNMILLNMVKLDVFPAQVIITIIMITMIITMIIIIISRQWWRLTTLVPESLPDSMLAVGPLELLKLWDTDDNDNDDNDDCDDGDTRATTWAWLKLKWTRPTRRSSPRRWRKPRIFSTRYFVNGDCITIQVEIVLIIIHAQSYREKELWLNSFCSIYWCLWWCW